MLKQTVTLALAASLAAAPSCTADVPPTADTTTSPPQAVAQALGEALEVWAEAEGHRGVSAAVVFEDGTEWVQSAGVEAPGTALTPEHLIWIASITKTMTGAVVLQLVEEERLSLDDPISAWLDPRPNLPPEVTVRQLLNHTNGLANYTANPELSAAFNADPSRVFTPDELLAFVGPPAFAPGERTQYTNTAFVLLGLIAEAVTGQPMTELYQERLFGPLGLEEIFLPGWMEPAGPVATAWAQRGATEEIHPLEDALSLLSIGSYAFGMVSNARTVARWGRQLFRGDVLSPEMRRQMTELVPAAGNIPGESGAGLGIRGYGYLGRQQWGHSGGSPLGSSLMLYDPSTGITVAVIMNQGARAGHFDLAPRLLEIAAGS